MEVHYQRMIIWPTLKWKVKIYSKCSPEEIHGYNFDGQFGFYAHYKSLYTRRESLETIAEQPGTNVILALTDDGNIIGYSVLAYPQANERWAKLGSRLMMEVKAGEVSRSWRTATVASGILKVILSQPQVEEKIFYMLAYAWTWDLDGTGKSAQEYRKMLIDLVKPFGFQEYRTNEPNVCLGPENIFLARIGENVSQEHQDSFKWLRLGIYLNQKAA